MMELLVEFVRIYLDRRVFRRKVWVVTSHPIEFTENFIVHRYRLGHFTPLSTDSVASQKLRPCMSLPLLQQLSGHGDPDVSMGAVYDQQWRYIQTLQSYLY